MALEVNKQLRNGYVGTYLRFIMFNADWRTGEIRADVALYPDANARAAEPGRVLDTTPYQWTAEKLGLAYNETAHILAAALAKLQTLPEWKAIGDQPYRIVETNINWFSRDSRVVVWVYMDADHRDNHPQDPIAKPGFDWSGDDFPFDDFKDDVRDVLYATLKAERETVTGVDAKGETVETPGAFLWPGTKDLIEPVSDTQVKVGE